MEIKAISGGTIENKGCKLIASVAKVVGGKVIDSGGMVYQVDNLKGGTIYISSYKTGLISVKSPYFDLSYRYGQ